MKKLNKTILKSLIIHAYSVMILMLIIAGCDNMTDLDHSVNIQPQNQVESFGLLSNSESVSLEITILSNNDGGASVINDNGIIAGWLKNNNGVFKATLWTVDENGNMTDQKTLGELSEPFGDDCLFQEPTAINSSGIVVGKASCTGAFQGRNVGFVYSSEMKALPWFLDDSWNWSANHINDNGVVSGHIDFILQGERLVRGAAWFPPYVDVPIIFSPLEQHESSDLYHMSQDGIITGVSYTKNESGRTESSALVRWELIQDGEYGDPVVVDGSDGYSVHSVNETGDIALNQSDWTGPALLRSGSIIELELLPNHTTGLVFAVSDLDNSGLVHLSGFSGDDDDRRAVYWSVSASGDVSGPSDLGLPANNYGSSFANGINIRGWVTGTSNLKRGTQRPTLWHSGKSGDNGDHDDDPTHPSDELTASFDYSCSNSDTCTFTDTSTGDNIVTRDWNPELNASSQIIFTNAEEHTVSLTITDSDGNSSSASKTIHCRSHPRHGIRCS
jgi:hypothetical protein